MTVAKKVCVIAGIGPGLGMGIAASGSAIGPVNTPVSIALGIVAVRNYAHTLHQTRNAIKLTHYTRRVQ
jgi:hypothetical protein